MEPPGRRPLATHDERVATARPSWLRATSETSGGSGPRNGANGSAADVGAAPLDGVGGEIERLRDEARRLGRADAQVGVPGPDSEGPTDSELELRDRCAALFGRWRARERRRMEREVAEREEQVADKLSRAALCIDRFQRVTNELARLKARYEVRRREVARELSAEGSTRDRGIPTAYYIVALVFLGIVEFFANAPVFSTLLPRDPLTERQIRLLTETSAGWLAGLERVGAHIIFRPDAALLAAGVITFLCVLAHFFGHSLRDLVMLGERDERRHTVHSRSARENVVPIILSMAGLVLTLGVLYEARDQLGEVGAERYEHDMAQAQELRRQAGWLRVDGEILEANGLTDQAEELEGAAEALREYSLSMARMNMPILLLNLTLVLCAISAAYFHRRDGRIEQFNESPFELDRQALLDQGEERAQETAALLSDVVRDIRELKAAGRPGRSEEWRAVSRHLESVLAAYRAENGRTRGVDPRALAAFRAPVAMDLFDVGEGDEPLWARDPDEYIRERAATTTRFESIRARFNNEAAAAW